jgi:mRNA deadenylase 3'-5' endonuclease subunit Ccr4
MITKKDYNNAQKIEEDKQEFINFCLENDFKEIFDYIEYYENLKSFEENLKQIKELLK